MSDAQAAYSERHCDLQNILSDAVDAAMNEMPEDPTAFIGQRLLAASRAASRFRHSATVKLARERAGAVMPSEQFDKEWSVSSWLGTGIIDAVSAALLRPLGSDSPPHVQLAFMRELGRDRGSVRALLDASVLERLTDAVCTAATKLDEGRGESAAAMSRKYAETTFTLSYGGLDSFFAGLEGSIGPPNPDLRRAMTREHTSAADSDDHFETSNYGVKTTSAIEWLYVVEPTADSLVQLGLDHWPREDDALLPEDKQRNATSAQALASFETARAHTNGQLSAINEPTLLEEELIGGRLVHSGL